MFGVWSGITILKKKDIFMSTELEQLVLYSMARDVYSLLRVSDSNTGGKSLPTVPISQPVK